VGLVSLVSTADAKNILKELDTKHLLHSCSLHAGLSGVKAHIKEAEVTAHITICNSDRAEM